LFRSTEGQKGKIYPNIPKQLLIQILIYIISKKKKKKSNNYAYTQSNGKRLKTKTWPVFNLEIQNQTISKIINIGIRNMIRGQHTNI